MISKILGILKILFYVLCGILLTLAVQKYSHAKYNDEFEDLFEYHKKMMESMDKMFEKQREYMKSIHGKFEKSHTNTLSITNNADCLYTLTIGKYDKKDISIQFENETLVVSGKKMNKDEKSSSYSDFFYSFSIPQYCTGKPDVEYTKNNIKIAFEKVPVKS